MEKELEKECVYNSKLRKKLQITEIIIVLALLSIAIISLFNYNQVKEQTSLGVRNFGLMGVFILTAFLEFVPQVLNGVVSVFTAILSGVNIHAAIIFAVLGSILGSMLGYEAGFRYGFRYVCAILQKKDLIKIINFWQKYGKVFVLLSALTPLPYIPLVFGALKMKRKDFVIWGIIPRIFNYIIYGYAFYYGFWSFLVKY